VKRTIVVLTIAVMALSLTALAADKAFTSPDGRMTFMPHSKAAVGHISNNSKDPALFSLLASKDPNGLYFCCEGYTIAGPDNGYGIPEYWEAQAFTPASSSHATKITVAISYVAGTFTDVILSLNPDCSGVPCSTPLEQWTLTLMSQSFGECCATEVQKVKPKVALTGGTQYWVVASTESDSDIWAAWNVEVYDEVDDTNYAYNYEGTWYSYSTDLGAAVEVSGTVP